MDKLDGTWRLNKITWPDGSIVDSESEEFCGGGALMFGLYCKWRWTLDNKGNATYKTCLDLSDSLCTDSYGTYEVRDNNKKIIFHGSFFSTLNTLFGTDTVLTLTELKRDKFKVQILDYDSAGNEFRSTYEFRKLQ